MPNRTNLVLTMPALNFVIGNKTAFYFSILPDEILNADEMVAPSNVNITLTAAGVLNATTLAVGALSGPVPAGTAIPLTDGVAPNIDKYVVYTTEHAATGDTSLAVEALPSAIPATATGTYVGMLLLVGGTTSDEQIQAKDQEVFVYGDELGFSDGIVTGASWSISYTFNVLPSDLGYYRLSWAAQNAVRGFRCWVRKVDPAPAGYTQGESIEGLCDVTDFSKTNPADGTLLNAA